ncbi:unnamed protein product [Closterium sp. Yama58-4]|nr:unnamed protein product [Closterium sp. Yama58-4]
MNAIMDSPARADPPFPVERLPDDALALVFRSLARTSFRHALVSKRWLRLATAALSHLTIRHRDLSTQEICDSEHSRNAQLAWLPLPRLLSALRRFPTLTHVSLGEFSIISADGDALFQRLAATCPFLRHLTVEHQFRVAVTVDGLASLFRGCCKLRELRLLTTNGLPHLPPSVSLLTDLQTLHVCSHPHYGDDSLQELIPRESIGALQQLRELRIRAGASFQGLGECVGLLRNLRKLSISNFLSEAVTSLPHAICDLARLESLEIELDGLECIPESFQLLTGLKSLSLQSKRLQRLPGSVMAGLTELQSLALHACDSLGILPESICFLPLSSLSISSCSSLISLPHQIGALSHLETLKLLSLDNIRVLPESLGDLPQLKSLELDLPALEHLPEGLCEGRLSSCLEKLSLTNCDQLMELPPSLYMLTCLESLHIESCSNIESLKPLTPPGLPEWSGIALESFGLAEKLIIVPFVSRLKAMVSPARTDSPFPIESLPDDVLALVLRSLAQTSFRHALVSKRWLRVATSALSHLTIRHRDLSMQEIRDSEHFRNAQLAWLPLPRLLSALRRFPTLTHVSLSEFSIVSADGDALFQCLAATCPSLSHLTVEHQFRMVVTVDGLASLFRGCCKLRELRLLTTFCLPHLPPSLSLLTDLQTLHVCAHPLYGDDSLQELDSPRESIGALQQLRELRIRAGASFQGLGECVGLLSNLRKLSIAPLP